MKGFSKTLGVDPGQLPESREYQPMPAWMLEGLEKSLWVNAVTGAPAKPPTPQNDELYIEDLVRLDVLSLEKQLQWCLYHLNHSFQHSWLGLQRALILAEELDVHLHIQCDRWLYTAEPEVRPDTLSLRAELARIEAELVDLDMELAAVGECCPGWLTSETKKNGKQYHRYMYYNSKKERKSHSVRPQELSSYRQKIDNKKLKQRLNAQINRKLRAKDEVSRAIAGQQTESVLHTGDHWVWRVTNPLSLTKEASRVSFSCYFEIPSSKKRSKHSKILPELKFQARATNPDSLERARESATLMAEFLNRFSPGRVPSAEILTGIRNMIASGEVRLADIKSRSGGNRRREDGSVES